MYKTKETALKHLDGWQIAPGDKFEHRNYDLFRNDHDVALKAVSKNYSAWDSVGAELRRDPQFARECLIANPDVYLCMRTDSNVVKDLNFDKLAARNERFMYFNDQHSDNKELALISVDANGGTIVHLSDRLKSDREIALTAVSQKGWALSNVSKELRNDKEVVLAAVKNDPMAISQASKEIYELCKGQDPAKTLESTIAFEKLQATLAIKPNSTQQLRKGMKL